MRPINTPPLYYAVKHCHYEATRLLIEHGANVNVLIKDIECPSNGFAYVFSCGYYHDVCLLHIAVSYNDVDIVRLLLDSGAKMSYICVSEPLISIAIGNHNHSMVDLLYERDIDNGIGFDMQSEKEDNYEQCRYDEELYCKLEQVLDIGDIDMVEVVAKHSDHHAKDIMLATAYDMQVDVSIIKRLLQSGADSSKIIEKATYHKSVYDVLTNN